MEYANSTTTQETNNEKTHLVFMSVQKAEGYIASDQTGIFLKTSNRGMRYIFVVCIYNPNFIKGIPIKSIKKEDLLRAYKEIYTYC